MPVKNEPNTISDGIKWEQDAGYSRAKVTIASGQNIALLEVVGQVTASGKFAALDPAGSDGTQVASGISILAVDALVADKAGVIINDDALVATEFLVWPAGITPQQKGIAIGNLEAIGIKAITSA